MTEVTETQLPGVGMRHEFTTAAGERSCSRTARDDGRSPLYGRADPCNNSSVETPFAPKTGFDTSTASSTREPCHRRR